MMTCRLIRSFGFGFSIFSIKSAWGYMYLWTKSWVEVCCWRFPKTFWYLCLPICYSARLSYRLIWKAVPWVPIRRGSIRLQKHRSHQLDTFLCHRWRQVQAHCSWATPRHRSYRTGWDATVNPRNDEHTRNPQLSRWILNPAINFKI